MQKTESKAISAEVAGLFDKIRSQAREYSAMMQELRALAEETAHQSELVQQDFNELRRNTNAGLKRVESLGEEALRTIEQKSETINRVYNELDAIESAKTSIQNISQDLSQRKGEINTLLKNTNNKINKMIEDGFSGLENKIALQFKQLKDDNRSLDQKLVTLTDRQRREIQMIQDDVDDFKSKVTETRYIVDETTKIIDNMIDDAHSAIESSITRARIDIETMIKNIALPEEQDPEFYLNAIARVEKVNETLLTQNKRLEQRISILQLVAIGCSIGAVILSLIISVGF